MSAEINFKVDNDANAVKLINFIIETIEQLKINTAVNVEETIMFNKSINSIKDARDNFASRNVICIKHAEKCIKTQNGLACPMCIEEEQKLR